MIDNFIDQNRKIIRLVFIILLLLPIPANIFFSNWSLNQQIENLLLSVLMLIIGGVMAFIVLELQVVNPICSRSILKFACNFFLVFGMLSILLTLVSVFWACIYDHQGIRFFYYISFGLLIVTNWIREKYAVRSSRFKV